MSDHAERIEAFKRARVSFDGFDVDDFSFHEETEAINWMAEEIERLHGCLVQIKGQVAIADDGNMLDVLDNIKHIAEGRFDTSLISDKETQS